MLHKQAVSPKLLELISNKHADDTDLADFHRFFSWDLIIFGNIANSI